MILQLKVRTLTPEVNTAKEKARLLLERAQRETGMESPDSNGIFAMFPDSLDEIDDKIHELKAEAELCMGTNQSVGVSCGHVTRSCDSCCFRL